MLEHLGVADPSADAITSAYRCWTSLRRPPAATPADAGFDVDTDQCAEDLAAAIVTAAARRFGNPHGNGSETIGTYTAQWGSHEWNLHERMASHGWRQRIA